MWPSQARASYPGHDGPVVYELAGEWQAGNLGSCDTCSGALSGVYRLDPNVAAKPIDDCLHAAGPVKRCGGGVPLLQCDYSTPPDEMCRTFHPSFSPDGRQLVFSWTGETPCSDYLACTLPSNTRDTIAIESADGSHTVEEPPLTASDTQPAFLPSGDEIVFSGAGTRGSHARRQQNLYEVTTTGTGLRQLTRSGAADPAPCANGAIAYVHAGNIYLLGRSGTTRRLTTAGGERPDCSPDGRQIAFVRGRRVYVLRVRDDRVTGPISASRIVSGPTFSPDGLRLAFTIERPTNSDAAHCDLGATDIYYLKVVNLDGIRQQPLHRVSDNGVDDGDCGGHNVTPGALTWAAM